MGETGITTLDGGAPLGNGHEDCPGVRTMRRLILTVAATLAVTACDPGSEAGVVGREAPPAAAVLAPGQDVPLTDRLDMVLAEIDRALDDEPDRVLTAEALTDQLLHAPRDVDWLAIGYSVEARLRQIQAQADAIVAALRRGSNTSVMEPDLQALRESVRQLQQQLELPGGGAAPPTLETLLAQDPLRDAQVPMRGAAAEPDTADPAAPARRGPLGAPVTRPPDGLD
jgi:hypothetical protein